MIRYDQHWLVDDGYIRQVIDSADIHSENTVLEIGPGAGVLTAHIAEQAEKVIAIEVDRLLKESLTQLSKRVGNVDIIWADALHIPFPRFDKLVSNLPFSIIEPLLGKLVGYTFESATLILGERFGHTALASPEDDRFGKLTVLTNAFY